MGLAMTRHVDIPMGRRSFSLGGSSPLLGGYFAFYVSQAHMGSITDIEKTIETALAMQCNVRLYLIIHIFEKTYKQIYPC